MMMAEKQVICKCGHPSLLRSGKDWCAKCGRPLFYDGRDRGRYRRNTLFVTGALLAGIGIVVYLFMEMIVAHIGG